MTEVKESTKLQSSANKLDLDKVHSITVLFFKKDGSVNAHIHKMMIDFEIDECGDFQTFRKEILKQGIDETRQKLGLMRCDTVIGYWKKEGNKMIEFKECHTEQQWKIALSKIDSDPEIYSILGKST